VTSACKSDDAAAEHMPIRGVIFDLFHTLTARESEWSDLPFTSDVLGIDRLLWNDLLISRSRWRLTGEEKDPYTIIRTLAHAANPSIPDEVIRKAVASRIQRFRDSLVHIPTENVETLRTLRAAGFRLGLISNADAMEVAAWPESPLAGLFDVEIFSCTAGWAKPDPEIFVKCLEALALPAEECLFVGDGGSDELVAAKSLGFSTAFVSGVIAELWPHYIEPRIAISDYHLQFVPEVLDLLNLPDRANQITRPV
jgi:putative hydrolase of the HAD superfamily